MDDRTEIERQTRELERILRGLFMPPWQCLVLECVAVVCVVVILTKLAIAH